MNLADLEREKVQINSDLRGYEREMNVAWTEREKAKVQMEREQSLIATVEKTVKLHLDKIESFQNEMKAADAKLHDAEARRSKAHARIIEIDKELLQKKREHYVGNL